MLKISMDSPKMQKLQHYGYDLKKIELLLGTGEYFMNATFGQIIVALNYLKMQWSRPTVEPLWDFEDWMDYLDQHYCGYYLGAVRDYHIERERQTDHKDRLRTRYRHYPDMVQRDDSKETEEGPTHFDASLPSDTYEPRELRKHGSSESPHDKAYTNPPPRVRIKIEEDQYPPVAGKRKVSVCARNT